MTDQEKQAQEALEAKMLEATKGFVKQDAIDSVKQEITEAQNVAIKSLEDKLVEQGNIINELKAQPQTLVAEKSVTEQVKDIIKEHSDGFKAFVNKSAPFKFELKAAGTMTIATNITGATTLLPTPTLLAGYNPLRRNPATFLDVASVRPTNSARISYVDQASYDGGAATTSEGSAKPAQDFDLKVSTSSAVKLAATTKISDEMLDDIDFMAQAVSDELLSRVRLAVSGSIYTYITSGMTPGYTTVNSAFADYYPLANPAKIWDVLTAAKATIQAGNHEPNTVFVNHLTFANMWLTKTTVGEYTQPILVTPNEMMFNGLRIIATNAVAGDKYIVCDIEKLNVYIYKDLIVEAGWENDDFTKNLRTFRGEVRVHYFVKDNDKTAFLYGDLSTDADYMTAAS
jgi:HK97 family phage major capsid protein